MIKYTKAVKALNYKRALNIESGFIRDPTSLWGSHWPLGQNAEIDMGEWGFPLDNDGKLTMGQPNSS